MTCLWWGQGTCLPILVQNGSLTAKCMCTNIQTYRFNLYIFNRFHFKFAVVWWNLPEQDWSDTVLRSTKEDVKIADASIKFHKKANNHHNEFLRLSFRKISSNLYIDTYILIQDLKAKINCEKYAATRPMNVFLNRSFSLFEIPAQCFSHRSS